ncbi:hypothetical protein [Streptomyces sp. 6-11-2]|uniref:hypothetical protein n=1 Tax=unclassified Streptomyces TaxID=2593676 RepID=UPI001143FE37|nr:hypothetical protein [Streptomyces sp. 6-11-2]GED90244.1 hypothetical protein TNCT6_73290 [Streptomyces sp. 6-11-2]
MRRTRHGAMSAGLALLVLLAALFCATTASPPAFRAASSSAAADPHVAPCPETLDDAGHGAPAAAGSGPCLKKAQPEQQHPRFGALLSRALPAQADDTAPAWASAHRDVRRHGPEPSPPDLTELSVRRV